MRLFRIFLLVAGFAVTATAREFTVLVYNVENLFDADGVAVYDDYQPPAYTAAKLLTKLHNIAEVLSHVEDGRGPDIILFQEIELDQTPATGADYAAVLKKYADVPLTKLLTPPVAPELAGLPAEAWLLKALQERGLTGYTVVTGGDEVGKYEDGNSRAIKNVIFTRFPVESVSRLPVPDARNILEVRLNVDGQPLYVFDNHWKSGAGDPAMEAIRVKDARVLRARLDEILGADPHADVIIGGDLNSDYNQKLRHRAMKETGVNDVLGSQGNELAIRGKDRALYNLWFELPETQRGSDVYQGQWGTLMQLIISRGLYDYRGVQYVDNSFAVLRIPGVNADPLGQPIRWSSVGPAGSGFSDHFPVYARFRTVKDDQPDRWLALVHPSDRDETEAHAVKVDYAALAVEKVALTAGKLPSGANLRDGTYTGKIFLVEGKVTDQRPFKVEFLGQSYEVYSPLRDLRNELAQRFHVGDPIRFYGELGSYRGRWQFVIPTAAWLLK
jgi:hypothetical protein